MQKAYIHRLFTDTVTDGAMNGLIGSTQNPERKKMPGGKESPAWPGVEGVGGDGRML